jgi:tetratricopeptide (TPR) repeat protein
VEALSNLGAALVEVNRLDEAIDSYQRAVRLKPESAELHGHLSGVLFKNHQMDEAIAAARQAIALKPAYAMGYVHLGDALQESKESNEAIIAYQRAIELDPTSGLAHFVLGNALCAIRRTDEGIAAYRQTIRLEPDNAATHWNLSLTLLRAGRLLEGWEEFEWRLADAARELARGFTQKQWGGRDTGGTVLLHAEGGMGDAIQFIRYVPLLRSPGTRFILECQPALAPLLANVPGVERVLERGQPLPPFDYHLPLQGLPRLFKTEMTNIPAKVPYLYPPEEYRRRWSGRMRRDDRALKVGLTWCGSHHSPDAPDPRSHSIETFAELSKVAGVKFYSVQKGSAAAQPRPAGMKVLDFGQALNDMADAAALMEQLDLMISVDTSTAHLAGALGRPVWVLLPRDSDFRWLLDRNDSPWYPTMRLFRQHKIGDWATPVGEMVNALRSWIKER